MNGQFDESERQIATAEELDTPIGQVRMVRGIVARYRDDPTAITHFEIAAEHLGQSVAVKALLANSYWDTWDVRAEPLFAELLALQPHTAEDFLFKGQIVAQYDDPRVGLRDIQRAREMRPSPLTWLASADARVTVALDSRSITDSEQALREAETARDLLPASDHALAANLSSRLALWDLYADRAGPGDGERAEEHRAAAGRLVAAAGGRWNAPLRTACLYYHARTGNDRAALAYIRDVLDRSQEPSVGFDLAAVLYGVGDLPGARAAAVAVRQTRDIRGWQDLIPWVFILAEEGKQDEAWAVAEALPKTPGFGFMTVGHLGWFLGEQENARRIYAAEIAAGRVPRFQNGWYLVLARFGAGDGTADDEQALIRHAGESRLRLCEAHFLIGMRHLARGNKEQARLHFENTLRTRVFYYFEHFWSRNFLSRMKADPGWPRWIKTK